MRIELTGQETADQLIKQLVYLRHLARRTITLSDEASELIRKCREKRSLLRDDSPGWALAGDVLAGLEENTLQFKFEKIEIGHYLMPLCAALDRMASREQVFDALCVGLADRNSDAMRKYGGKTMNIISVLDLENSATKDDDIVTRPLKWCHTLAFMNTMQTSEKLAKTVHDGANEFFDGAFGEYRETPLTERLVGRAV